MIRGHLGDGHTHSPNAGSRYAAHMRHSPRVLSPALPHTKTARPAPRCPAAPAGTSRRDAAAPLQQPSAPTAVHQHIEVKFHAIH